MKIVDMAMSDWKVLFYRATYQMGALEIEKIQKLRKFKNNFVCAFLLLPFTVMSVLFNYNRFKNDLNQSSDSFTMLPVAIRVFMIIVGGLVILTNRAPFLDVYVIVTVVEKLLNLIILAIRILFFKPEDEDAKISWSTKGKNIKIK